MLLLGAQWENDPFEFRIKDGEETAFKLAGAAVLRGRLFFDKQLDLVIVEVVRSPLGDRPSR